jgi:F-type H+-transporting ATPase subunit alpha
MALKASEISEIIKNQIKNYGKNIVAKEIGKVLTIGDGIALISGLENVQLGELVIFPGDIYGMILNLEEDAVGAVLLGSSTSIKEGDIVRRTKEVVEVPVGDQMLGRVINAIGVAIDGKKAITQSKKMPVFTIAPGVMTREEVNQPLETGIIAIDSMIPIGRGQRELIIGDRQTGKTAIAIDAIINQKGKNVNCVYVGIGQKNSSIVEISEKLSKAGAMKYTTIIKATASELPALQYLAPYTGITIAEE